MIQHAAVFDGHRATGTRALADRGKGSGFKEKGWINSGILDNYSGLGLRLLILKLVSYQSLPVIHGTWYCNMVISTAGFLEGPQNDQVAIRRGNPPGHDSHA